MIWLAMFGNGFRQIIKACELSKEAAGPVIKASQKYLSVIKWTLNWKTQPSVFAALAKPFAALTKKQKGRRRKRRPGFLQIF